VAWLGRHVRLFLSNATFVKATQPVYSRALSEIGVLYYATHQLLVF
jgi:hypothetical protein